MATETMINDAARKGSAQQSKLVSQQSNISDAFTRATIAERMIQEVTDRQVGTQKALVAKTETAIQTQMQAKSSGVDLDMLKQMSSVGYKSLHGEAAADLFKANALMDHILDPSLTIAWKVAIGVEKPANEIRETIKLDQRYLFDNAKGVLASHIEQLDKGIAPKDANWGMEAVVAGSMYKGINVEKRVETLYNLSVQKGQLTSGQQKELGDIYDLTSSNFIVHASTMGSMSMEKAEFQKGLERTAEGQTYLGYTLINAAVGKMAQYNLDAGVGVSTWDDPANTQFNIESKGAVAAGDVAVGSTTGSTSVVPVVQLNTSPVVARTATQTVAPFEDGVKVSSNDVRVNQGQQDKHIFGTNNYMQSVSQGKNPSLVKEDSQQLLYDFAGKGQKIPNTNKERVNFGKVIGQYYDDTTELYVDTTNGIIHYDSKGTAHIVPSRP